MSGLTVFFSGSVSSLSWIYVSFFLRGAADCIIEVWVGPGSPYAPYKPLGVAFEGKSRKLNNSREIHISTIESYKR